jgi:hypothetical protein
MSGYNLKDNRNIGEFIRAVLAIDNEEDAAEFYAGHITYIQRQIDKGEWKSDATPMQAVQSNIGWCFGEGMPAERVAMWSKVCGASHPVFGTKLPTAYEAFKMGMAEGEKIENSRK